MIASNTAASEMAVGAAGGIAASAEIDRSLEESFPASDLPSRTCIVRAGAPIRPQPQGMRPGR